MSQKNFRVTNVPISGMKMDEVTEMGRGLCARKPDVIFVTCGTNSMFPKKPPGATVASAPMSPTEVCAKLRELVIAIEREFPRTKVIISKLTDRIDIPGASEKEDP